MKTSFFRLLFVAFAFCIVSVSVSGQKLRPEFTARMKVGIYSGGYEFTGGVRLDDNWTVGLLAGQSSSFVDAAPGTIDRINTAVYTRRYVHLGKKDIVALYGDLSLGASLIYDVRGKYDYDDNGTPVELIPENPGDASFIMTFEPGVRIRFFRNIHIFFGPTFASRCLGLHAGIGF